MHTDPQNQARLGRLLGYLAQDPDNLPLLQDIIDAALAAGDLPVAQTHLARARALAPHDTGLRQREAHLLLAEKNYLAACGVLEHLLQVQPHPAIAFDLAYANFWLGQYQSVRDLLEPGLADPGAPNLITTLQGDSPATGLAALLLLLRSLHFLGDLPAAMAVQQQFAQQYAGEAEFLGVSSLLFLDNDQLEPAAQAANAAMVADSPPMEALVTSATVALGRGDLAAAKAWFEQALARNQNDGRSWSGMGLCYLVQRDMPKAQQALELAVEYMPSHIGTRHLLGWCHLLQGQTGQAQAVFQGALALDRNFGESHGALAVVQALQGQNELAKTTIRRANGLNPEGMGARFAEMLLERDPHNPNDQAQLQAKVEAVLAQQQAPFGGTWLDMMAKLKPSPKH
jgi:tetratricopeptide (TPR) repeat protein